MNIALKIPTIAAALIAGAMSLAIAQVGVDNPADTSASGGVPYAVTPLTENGVYLFMHGKMLHMKAKDTAHAMMMDHFKPIKAGTMIYVSGGNLYMAEDTRLPNGKMLSSEIFGKDLSIASQR